MASSCVEVPCKGTLLHLFGSIQRLINTSCGRDRAQKISVRTCDWVVRLVQVDRLLNLVKEGHLAPSFPSVTHKQHSMTKFSLVSYVKPESVAFVNKLLLLFLFQTQCQTEAIQDLKKKKQQNGTVSRNVAILFCAAFWLWALCCLNWCSNRGSGKTTLGKSKINVTQEVNFRWNPRFISKVTNIDFETVTLICHLITILFLLLKTILNLLIILLVYNAVVFFGVFFLRFWECPSILFPLHHHLLCLIVAFVVSIWLFVCQPFFLLFHLVFIFPS